MCCMIVLDANIVSGLSLARYSAVPPALLTSLARLVGNGSRASLKLAPVAFVPGDGAGLAPRLCPHLISVFTCVWSAFQ